jgi:hypothetical protein
MDLVSSKPVPLPEDVQRRLNVWKGIGALVLVGIWGYFGFIRNAEVPVLMFLDIAVHEVGHKVFSPFGETAMLMMGSGSQMLFPLIVGLIFGLWKRDLIAWGICWAWSANAFADSARYMADATQGQLALMGAGPDALGDWERIFGPEHWDKLYLADRWAHNVRTWGALIWCAALGLTLGGIIWNAKKLRDAERGEPEGGRERGPVPTSEPSAPLAPLTPEEMWR